MVYLLSGSANLPSVPRNWITFVTGVSEVQCLNFPVTLVGFELFDPSKFTREEFEKDATLLEIWTIVTTSITDDIAETRGYEIDVEPPSFMTYDEYDAKFGPGSYQRPP